MDQDYAVNTLWTSGWDSTYRVADLVLRQGKAVRPWYVMDENRRSTSVELRTLSRLRELLVAKNPNAARLLLPLVVRQREDIPEDELVTRRYEALLSRKYLGKQYEWLARLASAENVRLEIGLKSDDRPTEMLLPYTEATGKAGRFALVPHVEDEPLRLFERFDFPILDITKSDMLSGAREQGFLDILNQTWFCHCPTFSGKACGWCAPCQHAREEGFGWRVPDATALGRVEYLIQKVLWKGRLALFH